MPAATTLFDIRGVRALVTGGSRGLGAAAAEALADAGADIVLFGRDIDTLTARGVELARRGVRVESIRCDVSKPKQIESAVAKAIRTFGGIDILVNNAGVIARAPAIDYTLDDWRRVIDTDLTALFLTAQAVGRGMIERGTGKIINIGSLLSFSGGKFVPAYAAAKHGVAGLTKALANEWAALGVNVNAIAPGYFITDATAAIRSDRKRNRQISERIPAGRWGTPDDLKGAILFLASPASDYVHGHVLAVDGGWMGS
jgi:2-deoxy-D-gluconate 3-dehydrogenase